MNHHNKDKIILRKTVFQKRYRVLDPIRDFVGGTVYVGLNREDKSKVYLRVYHGFELKSEEEFEMLKGEYAKYAESSGNGKQVPIEIFKASVKEIPHPIVVVVLNREKGTTARRALINAFDNQMPINEAAFIISEAALIIKKCMEEGLKISEVFLQDLLKTNEDRVEVMHLPLLSSADDHRFDPQSDNQFYAPPERWENPADEINEKHLVYQLACLLFKMLEGETPFLGLNQEQKHKEEETYGLEGIPKKADKLIIRSLSKNPAKRPDLISFAKELRAFTKLKSHHVGQQKSGVFKLLVLLLMLGGVYFGYDSILGKKKKTKESSTSSIVDMQIRKVLIEPEIVEIRNMVLYQNISFSMGSEKCQDDDCKTVHNVTLSDYYLDIYEISNQQFLKYMEETGAGPPALNSDSKYNLWVDQRPPDRILKQPVLNITWDQAKAYCEHYSKRLPTEAEWEFAARGEEGRTYPWGEDPPDSEMAQFSSEWKGEETLYEVNHFKLGVTGDGVYNLLGGVKEWVLDYYDAAYYSSSSQKDPVGPEAGSKRVVRGGSWADPADPSFIRDVADPQTISESIGFRCAKTLVLAEPREAWVDVNGNEVSPPLDESVSAFDATTEEENLLEASDSVEQATLSTDEAVSESSDKESADASEEEWEE